MTPALDRILLLLAAAVLCSCLTTPLPMPPTVDPDSVHMEDGADTTIVVTGDEGSVDPGGTEVRVTRVGEPIDALRPERVALVTEEDGSFEAVVLGSATVDRVFFEELTEDQDRFIIAIRRGPDGRGVEADPGPDRDDDGSPDAIDCAPDDPGVGGRRCP